MVRASSAAACQRLHASVGTPFHAVVLLQICTALVFQLVLIAMPPSACALTSLTVPEQVSVAALAMGDGRADQRERHDGELNAKDACHLDHLCVGESVNQ